jgi:hypothetical protein
VFRVVKDLLIGWSQVDGGGQRLTGAGVAGQARVRATADLQAQAVSGSEHVGHRHEVERDGTGSRRRPKPVVGGGGVAHHRTR